MKGIDVKNMLLKNGFVLKEIASVMNETPQNLNSMLKADDIKTGVLERIAKAINKNLYFFFEGESKNAVFDTQLSDVERKLNFEHSQKPEAQPSQSDFSKVADACKALAESNKTLVSQVVESITRLEKKLDQKGNAAGVEGAALKTKQG